MFLSPPLFAQRIGGKTEPIPGVAIKTGDDTRAVDSGLVRRGACTVRWTDPHYSPAADLCRRKRLRFLIPASLLQR